MGGGASSLIRLRKGIVMRAYNLRTSKQTLDEQFRPYTYRQNGVLYIQLEEISKILSVNAPWLEELFATILEDGSKGKRMKFYDFVSFLETGKVAPVEVVSEQVELGDGNSPVFQVVNTIQPQYSSSVSRLVMASKSQNEVETLNDRMGTMEIESGPSTPGRRQSKQQVVTEYSVDKISANAIKPSIPLFSNEAPPAPPSPMTGYNNNNSANCEFEYDPSQPQPIITEAPDDDDEVDGEGLMKVQLEPGDPSVTGMHIVSYSGSEVGPSSPKVIKPLWKKREVLRQERTIHYTTVDATGTKQELVEKETNETEVVHMECRETGEFVHRELTTFEQKETFNDEVVNEQYGNDEYMHMKSKDDEIEYRESNMPPRAAEGPPHDAGVESTPRRDALDESMDSNVHNVGDEKMGHTPPARRRGEEENMSADEYERYRRAGHTPRGSHSVADMNDDDHSLNYPHDMYDITDLSDHEGADAHDRVEDVLPPLTASDMEGATDESYVHNFPSLNVDVDPSGTGGEHAYAPPSSHGLPSGGGLKRDKSSRATKKSSGVRFPDDPETAAEYGGGEGPPTAPTRTARFADDVPDAPAPHAKHKSRASYAHSTDANEDARKSKLSKLFDEDDDEVLDNRENAQQHRPTNENQTPLDVEPESDPLLRTSSSMFDID